MNALRDQLRAAQKSHDDRRHELDLHVHEIEDLRRALTDRENELERAEASKVRASQEKSDFARTVRELEADLLRVRKEAERFGNDLKALRKERDKLEEKKRVEEERVKKAERGQNQLKTELRLLKEELEGEKGRSRKASEGWRSHVCATGYLFTPFCRLWVY
jgi:chromosome segregation ATPase